PAEALGLQPDASLRRGARPLAPTVARRLDPPRAHPRPGPHGALRPPADTPRPGDVEARAAARMSGGPVDGDRWGKGGSLHANRLTTLGASLGRLQDASNRVRGALQGCRQEACAKC